MYYTPPYPLYQKAISWSKSIYAINLTMEQRTTRHMLNSFAAKSAKRAVSAVYGKLELL